MAIQHDLPLDDRAIQRIGETFFDRQFEELERIIIELRNRRQARDRTTRQYFEHTLKRRATD